MVVTSEQVIQELVAQTKTIVVDIYCRSAAQDGNTLKAQEATCRQLAEDAGFTVAMLHSEIASGLSLEREKLDLMRQRYKAGEIQGVVICTIDRLSRNAPDLLTLQEEMVRHNVALYRVQEAIEPFYQSAIARAMGSTAASRERE